MNNIQDINNKILTYALGTNANREGKYLIFGIENMEYGFQILNVREVIRLKDKSEAFKIPYCLHKIIDPRKGEFPVPDLKIGSNTEVTGSGDFQVIVIDVIGQNDCRLVGVIVDEVLEILDIQEEEIEKTHKFPSPTDVDFIIGLYKTKGAARILLDISKLLNAWGIPI